MARYRLKKETPELKKGAIMKLKGCEANGEYEYHCDDKSSLNIGCGDVHYPRETVEKQPKWFEKVSLMYLTKEQLKKIKKLLK